MLIILFHSTEMRHSVTTPAYRFRKAMDNILYSLTAQQVMPAVISPGPTPATDAFPTGRPSGWLPLYTMVTFRPDIGYATARRESRRQAQVLHYATWASAAVAVGTVAITCITVWRRFRAPGSAA